MIEPVITHIPINQEKLVLFCQHWGVKELALFGSVLREDFRPDSDVDVLITLKDTSSYTLNDLMQMEAELKSVFHRDIDLGLRHTVERDPNYIRRKAILNSAQVIYAE